MSKAINSPTARLLRSSRLFSLPPPLPAAPLEAVNSSGSLRSSDTATLPYPTHQAISTPASSRHRGDWGLKRPLPSRQIPKSNAHLRITAIDNLNHITDFASAADHTQTVQKWQELNMPMTLPQPRDSVTNRSRTTPVSAFEEVVDNTAFASSAAARDLDSSAISAERAILVRALEQQQRQGRQRWKTEGPWVNGLTEEEFQQYLAKTVRKHKPGFLRFLKQVRISKKKQQLLSTMRDEGLLSDVDPAALELELEEQSQLDEHELNDFIKELRDSNSGLSSELSGLVRQYFDLPAFPGLADSNNSTSASTTSADDALNLGATPSSSSSSSNLLNALLTERVSSSSESAPATHPSAGLSYIRTKAFMQNHPVYGPQASHAPVQARVVRPRSAIGAGNDRKANLGVAGFITEESGYSAFAPNSRNGNLSPEQQYIHNVTYLDPDTPGGNKVWVNPTSAHVDEKGHVQISVERADEQAVGVKIGQPIEAPSTLGRLPRYGSARLDDQLDSRPPPGTRGNANYGRALPDERSARQNVSAFDAAELDRARDGKVTPTSGDDQIRLIEQLARQHMENGGNKP